MCTLCVSCFVKLQVSVSLYIICGVLLRFFSASSRGVEALEMFINIIILEWRDGTDTETSVFHAQAMYMPEVVLPLTVSTYPIKIKIAPRRVILFRYKYFPSRKRGRKSGKLFGAGKERWWNWPKMTCRHDVSHFGFSRSFNYFKTKAVLRHHLWHAAKTDFDASNL